MLGVMALALGRNHVYHSYICLHSFAHNFMHSCTPADLSKCCLRQPGPQLQFGSKGSAPNLDPKIWVPVRELSLSYQGAFDRLLFWGF